MSRTVRDAKLETRQARLKLAAQREPHWRAITEGCHLGYYKGAGEGSWIARRRNSQGGYLKKRLGTADDTADADGVVFLSYKQAQDAAVAWFTEARGPSPAAPYTVAMALDDYLADYRRRGGKALRTTEISVDAFIRRCCRPSRPCRPKPLRKGRTTAFMSCFVLQGSHWTLGLAHSLNLASAKTSVGCGFIMTEC